MANTQNKHGTEIRKGDGGWGKSADHSQTVTHLNIWFPREAQGGI